MVTKYWLQYHKYDEHGFPGNFIINTTKPFCENARGDLVFLVVERKAVPDLAIEIAISSGDSKKLEKYKRFRIPEVWFWENNQLSLYRFREEDYQQISQSEFLPQLDITLLVRCVLMPSRLNARTEFLNTIRDYG